MPLLLLNPKKVCCNVRMVTGIISLFWKKKQQTFYFQPVCKGISLFFCCHFTAWLCFYLFYLCYCYCISNYYWKIFALGYHVVPHGFFWHFMSISSISQAPTVESNQQTANPIKLNWIFVNFKNVQNFGIWRILKNLYSSLNVKESIQCIFL